MSPAYLGSEKACLYLRANCQPADSPSWSNVPEYALDQGGPVLRPYQRMGVDFANVAVFDHLRNTTRQYPDKLAISDDTNRLTYSELFQAVETLSHRIAAIVPDGQAVGIFQANSVWYPVAMLASMAVGRPSVPLNTRDPGSRTNEIVAAARLSAILGDGNVRPDGLSQEVHWIDVTTSVTPQAQPTPQSCSVSVDAPAMVLYTSGSTGRPKGIVNSQRSLLWRVQQYVDACHINSDDVFLPLTGPATIAGCREVLAALLTGATLHLLEVEAVGLRAVRGRVKSEGVTITYLVPALLRALLADEPADAFRSLRVARIGGEKVSWTDIALLRKAVSKACLIQIGYSSTETTGAQWFLPRDWPEQGASVPVGWLLPGITFAIVDEEGRPVQPGKSGELLIRSRYVLLGQWENGVVLNAASDPDNPDLRIFATGDLVQLDSHGLLQIVGRKGRQIKINGRRVEPAELERVLRNASSVENAAAIVTAANELVAFAIPQPWAGPAFSAELRQLVRTKLPPPLRPLRLHAVAEIPRLASGKIDMATLAEMDLSSRKTTPTAQPPNAGSEPKADQIVRHAWAKVLNTRVAAGRWDDAGGDSLKLLHCVMEIESAIGQELGLGDFTVGMSVDEMVQAVVSAQAGDQRARAQEHDPPILFLFPGSVGYGPSLAAFAAAMGKVARVAPIRYPALAMILRGQNTLATIADAAVEQIRRAQPAGDIRLLGHSLGGAVAFEVAARLLGAGRSVKFLGILDTSLVGERSDRWETFTRTFDRIRTNRVSAYRMACRALAKIAVAMGCEVHLARILDRYAQGQFNATSFRTKLELQEVLRARAFFQWLAGPKPALPITGTLFRCARPGMPPAIGWDRAFAHLDVIPVVGSHIDLVIEPHVATNRPLIEKAVVQTYSPSESRKWEYRPST
ncbi:MULTISPECIES: AMP-binding protein [Mesorhizobium]|uniref:non-ribosomal peptide synthetase n=1 Tax=Mesorhizobium sp. TaxID=1871066 RepID=UPI000493CCF3|nr:MULTISPECIES: AMP-binding protein [Mesorhizobium]RWL20017.1 MAG: AMP-dependent synthetase [Mesorhizobium sp.]RWM70947.1 MAG: AMP-dependent synthetase [Mesorhizobium sp.]TIO26849.1 MAG: AMP-dependent synthetase [Mesorhizobium sp.]TJV60286.1 MAG: AMP-dependent synthetase [Mesorhizobium sp.]